MLAMGVDEGKAGTSLNRVFTNITLGNSATDAQVGAWNKLGFDPVQIAKDMQSTGPNGEDGATLTLTKVFDAISKQDKYQQTATIKTLFGQWAIEGVSKSWRTRRFSKTRLQWQTIQICTPTAWRKNCLSNWTRAKP